MSSQPPLPRALAEQERAVREVFDEVSKAWTDNDAAAFAANYAEDATATLPGFHLRSSAGIQAAMAVAFAGELEGSRRLHEIRQIRFLDDLTAIATSRSGTQPAGEPGVDAWSMATWVLSRHTGRWLIEAYHDCPAA
ncbi:SgcJ/EcaC family oxidoreductase [Streptomyces sp. NPDC051940]|uniref:SgcJ/EcaC family oxidoreductase n=1 Tax=Streptomyces sp. NPDC051940 TaxID=3155675 RepID=UPI00343E8299